MNYSDKNFVISQINKLRTDWVIQLADRKLQKDKDVVLAAMSANLGSYIYVDAELRLDPDVLEIALSNEMKSRVGAFCDFDDHLRDDFEIVCAAMRADPKNIKYASKRIQGMCDGMAWADVQSLVEAEASSSRRSKAYESMQKAIPQKAPEPTKKLKI